MNKVAEGRADELRRLIVERRREVLTLNTEFNRLQVTRASAAPDLHARLLDDIDRVAAGHRAATGALDALTDALIRTNRDQRGRTAGRHGWLRPWRATVH